MTNNFTDSRTMYGLLILFQVWANFLSVAGIAGYLAVCWTILKYKKTDFRNPFYTLLLSLALIDIIILSFRFIYVTPVATVGEENIPRWYTLFIGFLETWIGWVGLHHMVIISINRFVAVRLLQKYESCFNPSKIAVMLGACYVHNLAISVATYGCSCAFRTPEGYAWRFICDKSSNCAWIVMLYAKAMSSLILVATMVLSAATICRVRKLGQQLANERMTQLRKERALMIQFGMIFLVYIIYLTSFWTIDALGHQLDSIVALWVLGTAQLLQSCLNPYLLLTYGSDVKRLLFKGNSATDKLNSSKATIKAKYVTKSKEENSKENELLLVPTDNTNFDVQI